MAVSVVVGGSLVLLCVTIVIDVWRSYYRPSIFRNAWQEHAMRVADDKIKYSLARDVPAKIAEVPVRAPTIWGRIYASIKVGGVIAGFFAAVLGSVVGIIHIGIFFGWWPERL